MRYRVRLVVSCLLSLCFIVSYASGQAATEEYKVSQTALTFFPTDKHADVRFTDNLDKNHPEDVQTTNLMTLDVLPSGGSILTSVTEVKRDVFNPRVLHIVISPAAVAGAADNQVKVCFKTLHFLDPSRKPHPATTQVCGTGDIRNPENIAAELEKEYQVLLATPKTTSEKNIFQWLCL